MQIDPRSSYTAKVAVGLLVVLLVGGTAGAYTYVATGDQVRERQETTLGRQASVQDDLVDTIVADRFDDTERIAQRTYEMRADIRSRTRERREIASFVGWEQDQSGSISVLHDVNMTTDRIEISSSDEYRGQKLSEAGYEVPESVTSDRESAVAFHEGANASWVFFVPIGNRLVVSEVPVATVTAELDAIVEGTNTRIVDGSGRVVLDTGNASAVGAQHVAGEGVDSPAVAAGLDGNESTAILSADEAGAGERSVVGYDKIDGADWALVTYGPPETLFAVASSVGRHVLLLLGAVGVLLVGFGLVVERPTAAAVSRLSEHAETLRRGDLDGEIESDRDDEIGDLFRTFDGMRRDLRERIAEAEDAERQAEQARREAERQQEEAERARREAQRVNDRLEAKAAEYEAAMEAVAEGDLTVRVDPDSDHDVIESVGRHLNDALDELEGTIAEVDAFAADVVAASDRLAEGATEIEAASERVGDSVGAIRDGTRDQRGQLREVASETNNLSATIEEVASTADTVATTADETAERADDGRAAAREAVDAIERVESTAGTAVAEVDELVDQIHEVGEIVDIISDIAEQTNLLALNANIEAARSDAGGEGFAVVADEVKELATQTQHHADDIEASVADIQDQTESTADRMREAREQLGAGAETVEGVRETLATVADLVAETNTGMQDISEATDEQAASTEEVAAMVDDVAGSADRTADEAEQVAAAADEQDATLGEVTDVVAELEERAADLDRALAQFEAGEDAEVDGATAPAAAPTDD